MKLSRIPILREKVHVRDTNEGPIEFEVRGINLSDLMVLMHKHAPILMVLWGKLQQDESELRSKDVQSVFAEIAVQFPDLVAAVIALAADDYSPEGRTVAGQLTFDIQAQALESIFTLSFQSESSLEKLAALAAKIMQGTTRALIAAQEAVVSENGSGASAGAPIS